MKTKLSAILMLLLMITPGMAQINAAEKERLKKEYIDCVTNNKSSRYSGVACINFRNGVIYVREFEVKVFRGGNVSTMPQWLARPGGGQTLLPLDQNVRKNLRFPQPQ